MAKIVNGILILRKANSTDWTPEIDAAMVNWTHQYIHWLETWLTAYQESMSPKCIGQRSVVFDIEAVKVCACGTVGEQRLMWNGHVAERTSIYVTSKSMRMSSTHHVG